MSWSSLTKSRPRGACQGGAWDPPARREALDECKSLLGPLPRWELELRPRFPGFVFSGVTSRPGGGIGVQDRVLKKGEELGYSGEKFIRLPIRGGFGSPFEG